MLIQVLRVSVLVGAYVGTCLLVYVYVYADVCTFVRLLRAFYCVCVCARGCMHASCLPGVLAIWEPGKVGGGGGGAAAPPPPVASLILPTPGGGVGEGTPSC
jgi:hypothetical protein